ncbi:MAG TPA: hypothetical protein VEB64_15585 [Azospirillaceae bacterium]|nr:hypothetical protein [Azospirillaceae bacterium]
MTACFDGDAVGSQPSPPAVAIRALAAAAGCGLALAAGGIAAKELSFKVSLTQRVEQDSNALLSKDHPNATMGSVSSPTVDIKLAGEKTTISVRERADIARFADDQALNRTDNHLTARIERRGPRDVVRLEAGLDNQATSAAEAADTGRLAPSARQTLLSLTPTWVRDLTQRNRLILTASHLQLDYDNPTLTGYTRQTAQPGLEHRLSPRDTIQASALYDHFESRSGSHMSDGYGGVLTFTRYLNQRLTLRSGVGMRWSDSVARGQTRGETNWLADLGLAYKTLTGTYEASYARSVDPTGLGDLRTRDDWRLSTSERLDERTTLSLVARYMEESAGSAGRDDSRRYLDLMPTLRYRWTEEIEFSSSFRHRWQMYGFDDEPRVSDALLVSLSWQPLPWTSGL